jgi:2-(1,2-epoxy-1,2-dihydrophenyl)acetyl-CoA isomerase
MIDLTVANGVAEVVLNAPAKLNTLDRDSLGELSQAYTDAASAGVRALVLRGEGRAFCAGRDISNVDAATDNVAGYLADLTALMHRMDAFPAPTFAIATGACLGVGLGLLIATDVVYAADTARIGSPFANLGAILDSGGHHLFYERLGAHRTLDLMYTAELMTGSDAVALGLFSRVVAEADILSFTRSRVARVADGPAEAFLASKRLVHALRDGVGSESVGSEGVGGDTAGSDASRRLGFWEALADESAAQVALAATPDYREGFAAFREKRPPRFRR